MSEASSPLIIAFYHVYKCGGSTFNQILESNFPRAVLYAESRDHGLSDEVLDRPRKRLEKQPLENYLNSNNQFRALSSHLASPDIASLALQAVTIIRHPLSRMMSAYSFDKVLQNIPADASFDEYASNNINTMTKRLYAGQREMQSMFCGVLEMFDESMILLEHMMYNSYGVQVDLSYAKPLNKSSGRGKALPSINHSSNFKAKNSEDYELYQCTVEFMNSSISSIQNWDNLAFDYRRRKENRIQSEKAGVLNIYPSGNNPEQCILL